MKDLYLRIVAPRKFFTRGAKRDSTPHWENAGSLQFLRPFDPEPSLLTIALRHPSRVHICISKGNYHKVSCMGEHNKKGTSPPWVNKQGNQWCARVIFVESESSQSHEPLESESSEILSSRVMTWLSRVRVESQEWSSHFESLDYKLESMSSHTKFQTFPIYFWL